MSPTGMPAPTSRHTAPSRRVGGSAGWAVMAALGLHAALGVGLFLRTQALVPGHTPDHSASASGAHVRSAAMAMQVRWAPQATGRAPEAAPSPEGDTAQTAIATTATAATEVPPTAEATALANTPANASAIASATNSSDTAPADTRTALAQGPSTANGEATFTGYARRDMLDRPPQALGIVQIGYPPGVEPGRVRTGRLTLFIDEAGAVRKVMVASAPNTEDALPAPFVEAAREAFLQARFAPGERLGMAVKSRIDVEVSFDGRETNPADPASPVAPVETAQQPNAPAGTGRSV